MKWELVLGMQRPRRVASKTGVANENGLAKLLAGFSGREAKRKEYLPKPAGHALVSAGAEPRSLVS